MHPKSETRKIRDSFPRRVAPQHSPLALRRPRQCKSGADPGTIDARVALSVRCRGRTVRRPSSAAEIGRRGVLRPLAPRRRSIAFSEEPTNDLEAAFDSMLDVPVGERLRYLPDAVFVFCRANPPGGD